MAQIFYIYLRYKNNAEGKPVAKKATRELIEFIDDNIITINKSGIMIEIQPVEKNDTAQFDKLSEMGIRVLPALVNGRDAIETVPEIKKYITDAVRGSPQTKIAEIEKQAAVLEEEDTTREYFESVLDEDDEGQTRGSDLAVRAAKETQRRGIGGNTAKTKPLTMDEMRKKRRAARAAREQQHANPQQKVQLDDNDDDDEDRQVDRGSRIAQARGRRDRPTQANVRADPVSIIRRDQERGRGNEDDDLAAKFWEKQTPSTS